MTSIIIWTEKFNSTVPHIKMLEILCDKCGHPLTKVYHLTSLQYWQVAQVKDKTNF
jgi:hypothetical protein